MTKENECWFCAGNDTSTIENLDIIPVCKKHRDEKIAPPPTEEWRPEDFESFDSFFAGLPRDKEKDAIYHYEKYIQKHISILLSELTKRVVGKTEKAFGGCKKCYGKGYSTQMAEIGNTRWSTGPRRHMNFCSCERGKQLEALLTQ